MFDGFLRQDGSGTGDLLGGFLSSRVILDFTGQTKPVLVNPVPKQPHSARWGACRFCSGACGGRSQKGSGV
jgi:hypothetical protein